MKLLALRFMLSLNSIFIKIGIRFAVRLVVKEDRVHSHNMKNIFVQYDGTGSFFSPSGVNYDNCISKYIKTIRSV